MLRVRVRRVPSYVLAAVVFAAAAVATVPLVERNSDATSVPVQAAPATVPLPAQVAPAVAATAAVRPVYLALGDSIAFGYSPLIDPTLQSSFVGYPTDVAAATGRILVNASCPGETSAGFLSLTGVDNGCRSFRAVHPLHVDYTGTQMDFAVDFLRSHPQTDLVTLGIGANDVLHCQRSTADYCASELNRTLRTYQADLKRILTKLRAVYDGRLVVVNYYSRNYHNKTITGAFSRLDTAISRTVAGFHVKLANTFAAFARPSDRKAGNACTAGLLIELPHTCNIHPTAKGRQLLADTVVRAAR